MTPVDPVFIWLITRDIFSPLNPMPKLAGSWCPKEKRKEKTEKKKVTYAPSRAFMQSSGGSLKDNDREYVWALRVSHKPIFVPA